MIQLSDAEVSAISKPQMPFHHVKDKMLKIIKFFANISSNIWMYSLLFNEDSYY